MTRIISQNSFLSSLSFICYLGKYILFFTIIFLVFFVYCLCDDIVLRSTVICGSIYLYLWSTCRLHIRGPVRRTSTDSAYITGFSTYAMFIHLSRQLSEFGDSVYTTLHHTSTLSHFKGKHNFHFVIKMDGVRYITLRKFVKLYCILD